MLTNKKNAQKTGSVLWVSHNERRWKDKVRSGDRNRTISFWAAWGPKKEPKGDLKRKSWDGEARAERHPSAQGIGERCGSNAEAMSFRQDGALLKGLLSSLWGMRIWLKDAESGKRQELELTGRMNKSRRWILWGFANWQIDQNPLSWTRIKESDFIKRESKTRI